MTIETVLGAPLVLRAEELGSARFRSDYGVRYAYTTGAMYQAIASTRMVVALGRARILGFFGSGGLQFSEIEKAVDTIQGELGPDGIYGFNLLEDAGAPENEERIVDLYLQRGIRNIEAAAYLRMTPTLVRFRASGLRRRADGSIVVRHRVVAKVSRPEVAEAFMSPAPAEIARALREAGTITAEQCELTQLVPMSDDVCVESDSGGHTDQGVAFVLIPAIVELRDAIMASRRYETTIRVGAAGGIGTPHAAAAAFVLGADFITTGSINQCSVESGASDAVKDLLQTMDVSDTAYAPAGDMFEIGARVQVSRKGLLFPARANRLFDLYRHYESLEELPAAVRRTVEQKYFHRTFEEVWEETKSFYAAYRPGELARAERSPKARMALVFRWYFVHTNRLARAGSREQSVDYQVHCGPALGAFNRWVRGTPLESWHNRNVVVMAEHLMTATAELLSRRISEIARNVEGTR